MFLFWKRILWKLIDPTLQMFCLLNPQMNACEPNPKTTSSDFNRLESVTKIFCFHTISKDIWLLFSGSFVLLFIILLNNSAVFTPFYLWFQQPSTPYFRKLALVKSTEKYVLFLQIICNLARNLNYTDKQLWFWLLCDS